MSSQLPKLTITGFSTALFSTWYFVDELSLLFDCGDGVSAGLLQKSRKIKHVFISHSDRDHMGGLVRFSQLNSRPGLKIYYPHDSGSFPAMEEFIAKFDPEQSGTQWIPVTGGQEFEIRNDLVVRAVENSHIKTQGGQVKSLSFFVDQRIRKLKPELAEKTGTEIAQLRKDLGEDAISDVNSTSVITYSGDTPIETDGRYNDVETLIHEATFLRDDEIQSDNPRRNKHSSLDQVLAMVAGSNIKRLVLGHFSSRYDNDKIDAAIERGCQKHGVNIPVYRILPGWKVVDILGGQNLNQ